MAAPDTTGTGDAGFAGPPHPRMLQFSFLPDFSRGVFASRVDHVAAVNLLAGSADSSCGFEVGGLANFESGDVSASRPRVL